MIPLGNHVIDKLTGFEGIAVCRTEWLYGCVRLGVQGKALKPDGTPADIIHFDLGQLIDMGLPNAPLGTGEATPGGERPAPLGPSDPRRR